MNGGVQGLTVASSFVNYRPCLLAASPNGINVGPTGVLIQPVGILIQPKGVNIQPRGINFQPTVSFSLQPCLPENQQLIMIYMDAQDYNVTVERCCRMELDCKTLECEILSKTQMHVSVTSLNTCCNATELYVF